VASGEWVGQRWSKLSISSTKIIYIYVTVNKKQNGNKEVISFHILSTRRVFATLQHSKNIPFPRKKEQDCSALISKYRGHTNNMCHGVIYALFTF
jgi:hypothetical protein